MAGLTVKLQKTNDIYKAFAMVSKVKTTYRNIRTKFRAHFDAMYDLAVELAEKVGTVPTAPKTTGRQLHRANAPAVDTKEYYQVNVAVPFLDHIISGLTMRVSKPLGLVPPVIQESQITAQQLNDLVDLYKDDLPSPQLFFAKFQHWKIKVQAGIITAGSCTASLAVAWQWWS